MFAWLNKLRSIVTRHQDEVNFLHHRIDVLEKIIKERTDIAADIHFSGKNHIIVIGQYKNTGYVQTYSVNTEDLHQLIQQLKHMEQFGVVRTVDAPPTFRGAFRKF
jgi:hypothetical protein